MQASARVWRHFDVPLLAAVTTLTFAGVAMIQSAIAGNENLAGLVPRQLIYAVIGLVVVLLMAAIDYRFWSAVARPMYLLVLALLVVILLAGFVGFGSARWFNAGIVLIQPSEVSKILMVIVLADYLARHAHEMDQFKILLRSLLLAAVPVVLIILQPNLSTAVVIVVMWTALVFAAGAKFRHFLILVGIAVVIVLALGPLLVQYFTVDFPAGKGFLFLKHYQMQRVVSFLFPDPTAAHGLSYNVNQALISIGSGGWFGQGYGHGTQTQLRFLKVRHTDFIFSALSEEFGFVGALAYLLILGFIILRCLRAARLARDQFGALIGYGVAILLMFQASVNIGMNLNLFPVSGLPLPFFSYGGSSLVASLLGVGLVESVILRHKRIEL